MAGFLTKFVTKKILGETLENKFGKEDPYFETIPATRLDGKPSKSKTKRRKKALPPGLSGHDARVLTKVKGRAYRLDMCLFTFLGMHFGWGTVIGFIPVIGDAIDAFFALLVLKTCMTVEGGLPASLRIQMLFNIFFDFVVGLVPFLGDMLDAIFRCNTRNAIILEEYLREKGRKSLHDAGQPIPTTDPSDPVEFDRMESNLPGSRQPSPNRSRQPSPNPSRQPSTSQRPPRQPEPAATRGGGGSWFGRNKQRPGDVETGNVERRSDSRRTPQRRSSRH